MEIEIEKLRSSLLQHEEAAALNDEKINRLQTLIDHKDRQLDVIRYQTDFNQKQKVSVSKLRFYLLICLLILLSLLSIYALFYRGSSTSDSTELSSDIYYNNDYLPNDSMVAPHLSKINMQLGADNNESLSNDSIISYLPKTNFQKENVRKPKNLIKHPLPNKAKPLVKIKTQKPKINFIQALFKQQVKYRPRYKMAESYANLYRRPKEGKLNNVYLFDRDRQSTLTALREKNGFIYVAVTNKKGGVTRGWLRKTDLRKLR